MRPLLSAVLVGPMGTGKTRAAVAIGRLWSRVCRSWRFLSIESLQAHPCELPGRREGKRGRILAKAGDVNLFIPDDVGAVDLTDHARGFTTTLIDRRYRGMRPTIITTSIPAQELETMIGQPVADRLREGGKGAVIVFAGASMRGDRISTREIKAVDPLNPDAWD